MGTLTPSPVMVKVCETPVSGFSEVACVAGASALGLLGSRGRTDIGPMIPLAIAYGRACAVSALASSKLKMLTSMVVLAGHTEFAGTYAGPTGLALSMSGVSILIT